MGAIGAILGGIGKAAAGAGKGLKAVAQGAGKVAKSKAAKDLYSKAQGEQKGGDGKNQQKQQQGEQRQPFEYQGSFKKGGKVKKTGVYRLHKGEVVVSAKHAGRKTKKKTVTKR